MGYKTDTMYERIFNGIPEWSIGELAYLRTYYGKKPAQKIADNISAIFGNDRTVNAVYDKAASLGMAGKRQVMHGDLPGETWKSVAGASKYEVSNKGRLRNMGDPKGCLMRLCKSSNGSYQTVIAFDNGKPKTVPIHRLVAAAFIENTEGLPYVQHIDGDSANNCVENLAWKVKRKPSNGGGRPRKPQQPKDPRQPKSKRDPVPMKISDEQVLEMRRARQAGATVESLSIQYSIHRAYCSRLLRGLKRKSVPMPA